MKKTKDSWTVTHDLALIYVALAYGTDSKLSDEELNTITARLQGWSEGAGMEEVQEVVLEAIAVFLQEDAREEIQQSMRLLKETLSEAERRRALEEIVQVAMADGVLLRSERSLISALASVWEVKATGDLLLQASAAQAEHRAGWTLLHDIALVYVIVAHAPDNELSSKEIGAILERSRDWQPDLEEEEVRRIVREALQFYSESPEQEELQKSVWALRDSLPVMQRLALLNDLVYISEADGAFDEQEKSMIHSLSRAWNLHVRFNGTVDA